MTDQAAILRIRDNAAALTLHLGQWAGREPDPPSPDARRAANEAVTDIDAMLADLYQVRQELLGEMRETDDAAAARVDALLARHRRNRSES